MFCECGAEWDHNGECKDQCEKLIIAEEYRDLKIDDIFIFYASTGYINTEADDELTVAEITGADTQEQLDEMKKDKKYMDKCFEDEYNTFMSNNVDSGWYKKKENNE
jgi:hypothetical protein